MKKLLLLLLIALHSITINSQEIAFVQDSILNYYMVNKIANKKFIPTGKKDKNDLRQGKWKDYTVEKDFICLDINGKPKLFYGNYLIYAEGKYKDGKREGLWGSYLIEDKSFKKHFYKEENYLNGNKNSEFKYYFPNKKLASHGKHKENLITGEMLIYYNTGELYSSIFYSNGKRNGENVYYYKNGKVNFKKPYSEDVPSGQFIAYYEDGTIQEEFEYKSGKEDGSYKYYYPNGQLWIEKIYDNGRLMEVIGSFSNKGEKMEKGTLTNGYGSVFYYTEKGEIYTTQFFENGVRVREEKLKSFDGN
ncbi:MAG: hypothetical protein R2788_16900 [Saprospiraceae bacterium]|jgi:antitoxin component YwqK of YwqJK toxin-antitoxin module